MGRADAFRRACHLASPFWLTYYLLPPDSFVGVAREAWVFVFILAIVLVETARLSMKVSLPGLRDYEMSRPAAYAMGGIGIGMGLLFFPVAVTVVAVTGMAWVDPICGLTRRTKFYPIAPLAIYFLLALSILLLLEHELTIALLLAGVGSTVAIVSEYPKIEMVDDDFVMTFVPLVVLGGSYLMLGALP